MASKNSMAELNGIYENLNLNWELSENDKFERLKYISLLGYHDICYRAKHCFLYCCILAEVVAERYLTELIGRGLLQDVQRNGSGRPKTCKMHDILRELALSISKSDKFVAKSDGKE
ncbi:hypothetical protein V6N11_008257 [Hibiscus sabdariffa]|uniref:Disease resistance protein winged helix domain-containing protein n=1 Tax=Hibiscus sabdariffa TaxID=183260 RepID=A0ABR2Q0R4_9ROSI